MSPTVTLFVDIKTSAVLNEWNPALRKGDTLALPPLEPASGKTRRRTRDGASVFLIGQRRTPADRRESRDDRLGQCATGGEVPAARIECSFGENEGKNDVRCPSCDSRNVPR